MYQWILPTDLIREARKKKRLCTLSASMHNLLTNGPELLDQAGFFVVLGSTVMQRS